jgi:integrase/recombinase XerC/integrase/recombinase XerD
MRAYNELKSEFLYSRNFSDGTIRIYDDILKLFARWVVVTGRKIDMILAADLMDYKRYLTKEKGLSFNTVSLYLIVIQSFFDYLYEIGEHGRVHIKRIGKKKDFDSFVKEHLTDEEQRRLTNYVGAENGLIGKRDKALITLLLLTGIRCVEASRLTVEDLEMDDPNKCQISVQRKGAEWKDTLNIYAPVPERIREYLEARGVSDEKERVFVTHQRGMESRPLSAVGVAMLVNKIMKKAGVYSKRKTAHSLRHTAAVNAVKLGMSPWEVQAMLGHRDIRTTQIYVKSVEKELSRNNTASRALCESFLESEKKASETK